ncbi:MULTISPECIES: flagellar biosynthesis anti-sigma factor FlgM [Erwinia]|uniref:Negative regulator of flagellin synthesis n=1 Tax=Erwinia pyrifoliae TaxID=79967 RepID=A0ABY5XB36_ERWPY|nr:MULTISPECIES: flagellar biosynthesis anti-sigma factor FlgM [Erwinia]ADP09815.1 negative regulator of flagellin synthesis [Erwinia sp. Ejp617]AUX73485.1 flagellar biosynthesis anti-sigma factor FlgM [Erwinia pyrifoliae]MCA8876214.1 flagellar biosynthesis anti-sigma factor FlgM [Erwinia pyrifoliae]MCT2386355.1 flagellar biosynthesis anti-sigma factor FlgM [Erwinia pyrifoliae]MCU8588048.1 flagellar biosynthesis anti-sigma factor FlgM [Erwinia pyrifoliae]
MSIDRTTPAAAANAIAAVRDMRGRQLNQDAGNPVAHNTSGDDKTQVRLSSLVQQMKNDSSNDIDEQRVAEIRAALDAGELPLDPQKIARALVMDIFQFN